MGHLYHGELLNNQMVHVKILAFLGPSKTLGRVEWIESGVDKLTLAIYPLVI